MGHSFGGATALHAASQKPPKSVLAHDPASDWMPHTSRLALFDIGRLRDSATNHSYWTSDRNSNRSSNGLNEDENENKPSSLHDSTELFVLFSDEWYQKNYAGVDVLKDMYDRKVFGPAGGVSKLGVIEDAYHQEFSDACMITPLWIAREVGLTGPRNPLDTAREIHIETVNFLKDLSIN
jgi:pimeloyl-ACP methyl ester carboxylesterase